MFTRIRRFFDQYGLALGAMLFTLICWFAISNNFHHTRAFFILSPVNWVLATSASSSLLTIIDPMVSQAWWVPLETVLSAGVWLIIFFGLRGFYYSFTSMNAYYGIALFIMVIIVIAFIVQVVLPTFEEINGWWGNWLGNKPLFPGG